MLTTFLKLNGTTKKQLTPTITPQLSSIGPRMSEVNGLKNGQTNTLKAGPRRKEREVDSSGTSNGIKNASPLPSHWVRKVKSSKEKKHLKDRILRSLTVKNGVKMRTLRKNGTRNGAKFTDQTKERNGVTNGKLI